MCFDASLSFAELLRCGSRFLLGASSAQTCTTFRSTKNIKQIITKQQSVYAVAVCACELASWATGPWNVLWVSLQVLHVFP